MGRAASQIDGAWIPSRTGRPVKSRKKKKDPSNGPSGGPSKQGPHRTT
jgi:hypothetical protein